MSRPHIPDGADEFRAAHELRAEDDGNRLVGYAAVFNQDTVINSWEGHFVERIAPGAFKKTLKERGDKIKVLFNHGQGPLGDMPLGKPDVMREDTHGLYVEVPLSDTKYNKDIRALLKDRALDGMSFRFTVPQGGDEWDEKGELPVRTIRALRMYEFGPVVFPAYEGSTAGLRADPRMMALREQLTAEDLTDKISPTPEVLVVESDAATGTSPDAPLLEHAPRNEDLERATHMRSRMDAIVNRARFLPETRRSQRG